MPLEPLALYTLALTNISSLSISSKTYYFHIWKFNLSTQLYYIFGLWKWHHSNQVIVSTNKSSNHWFAVSMSTNPTQSRYLFSTCEVPIQNYAWSHCKFSVLCHQGGGDGNQTRQPPIFPCNWHRPKSCFNQTSAWDFGISHFQLVGSLWEHAESSASFRRWFRRPPKRG
jgi:hypothetical protein